MAEDYRVLRKERTTVLIPGGIPTQGYRVWFDVPETSTVDYIEIPESDDVPAKIHALLKAKTDLIIELFTS
jgi:hypothetical protein